MWPFQWLDKLNTILIKVIITEKLQKENIFNLFLRVKVKV